MLTRTFASDNFSSVDPRVLDYLQEINARGHAQSYEGDDVTLEAAKLFEEAFGDDIKVLFVPTGTGANILAVKLLVQHNYDAVVCSRVSHIYEEESGALAAAAGVQIFPVAHNNGKIDLEALKADVVMRKALEYHSALPKIVSIANSTEYGTFYTPEEIKAIADFCHANDMYLHMDGCRLVNVAAKLNLPLRAFTRDAGVDILCFGGAKNGLMSAESIVIFNAPESDLTRLQKQTMQLMSKMRYVSGQFVPYMRGEAWRENAHNANTLAKRLADGLQQKLGDQVQFTQPVDTNQVFCIIPDATKQKIRAAGHTFYDWNTPGEVRFVTAWDNTAEDVDNVLALL